MKKILFLVAMFVTSVMAAAQELSVIYQVGFNFQSPHLFEEAGVDEQMRTSLTNAYKDVTLKYQLLYKNGESEFRIVPSKERQDVTIMGYTMDINAVMAEQANNYVYKNQNEGIILNKTSVFGKDFLITDSIGRKKYIIDESETKEILGFECIKAVSEDGKNTAWFTPHIPINDGPETCSLGGLVLQLYGEQMVYTAIEINEKVDKELVRPEGGKKMTEQEFKEMVMKRVEMMKRG